MIRVELVHPDTTTIVFNDTGVDAFGSRWLVTDLEGWDSPAMRTSMLAPTSVHGGAYGEWLYGPRSIKVGGVCKPSGTSAAFWSAWNRLLAVTNIMSADGSLIVTEDTVSPRCKVRRSAPVRHRFHAGWFEFEFNVIAANPFKYVEGAAGGSATYTNVGNAIYYPRFMTTGATTPVFTHTDDSLTVDFTASVPSGTEIDFRTKTVTGPAGENLYSSIGTKQWWGLKPGTNAITITGLAQIHPGSAWA